MVEEKEIIETINKEFKDKIDEIQIEPEFRIKIATKKDNLIELASFIKHELGFTHPNICIGTDYKDHIEVIWVIGNPKSPLLLLIKSTTDRDKSDIPSLTPIWKGFDWHERETYDLLGVNFKNHPDLRRIIMPENWDGYPLREDYVYKKPKYRKLED